MGSEPEFQNLPRGNSSDRIQWRIDVLPQVKVVLSNFRRIGVNHPTIRAVYYKLYSMGAIPANELKYYKGLDRMLTDVRMEQDDDVVKPDTFADDSRIEPEEVEMETPEEYAEAWVSSIQSAHERYEPPIWYKQPKYVEVWIEKNAMYSTFQSILSDKQVVIQSSRGFNSLTAMYRAAWRLLRVRLRQRRDIVILYFGDLDPSGDSMDADIQRRLRAFGVYSFEFVRVGVKPEHVQQYNLPADPDEDTAARLRSNDSRTRKFIQKYDKLYAIELDALAGQEPEVFADLVRDAVDQHYDYSIWEKQKKHLTPEAVKRQLRKRVKIIKPEDTEEAEK